MKRILIYLIFVCPLFIPTIVKANIICNDGTISKSCQDCHQGCCSRHGGCTNNPNTGESNDSYSDSIIAPEPEPVQEPTPSPSQETQEPNEHYSTEDNDNVEEKSEEQTDNNYIDDNSYNYDEKNIDEEDQESSSTLGGLATLATIGAVIYGVKKKKG